MNCKNFKNWLVAPETFSESDKNAAVNHIQICSECKKLYLLDSRLEEKISTAFNKTEPPSSLLKQVEINSANSRAGNKSMWLKSLVPIVAAAMLILFVYPSGGQFTSTEQLGSLAIADHIGSPSMQFKAGEVDDVPKWFEEKIGKKFIIPVNNDKSMKLAGGLKCHLGESDVALLCYKKNDSDKTVSLFIVDQGDIDFDFETDEEFSMNKDNYSVKIWKERSQIYAMVE